MGRDLHQNRASAGDASACCDLVRIRKHALVWASAALVSACGGGNGGDPSDTAALALMAAGNSSVPAPAPAPAPDAQNEPPVQPPVAVKVRCTMDTSITPSYEERRMSMKLAASDALTFTQQVLQASGFDKFGPEFALTLCENGTTQMSSYEIALKTVKSEGQKLWQAAVDRVQGRKVEGTLPQSDDRMLYWARLSMTLPLRQWTPEFALDEAQRKALQDEFERASRGQYTIDFPEGSSYKRILVSGFDPFSLGDPAGTYRKGVRIGNPSGAIALALDGNTIALADGSTAVIRTFVLPVNYGPFIEGMHEDALGPWFKPGSKRVDASISISQGGTRFDLEQYNGRYHFSLFGNDNLRPDCADSYPATGDCQIHPPERWLGYASKPWKKDSPAQFTQSSLPFQWLIDANTGAGVANPETGSANGWGVARNGGYEVTPCTKAGADAQKAYEAAQKAYKTAFDAWVAAGSPTSGALWDSLQVAQAKRDSTPKPPPELVDCAKSGSGGNYLSNASAYRNTLMRDIFGLSIPAGHIHTPSMTKFESGHDTLITDPMFEAMRDGIVAQARNLVAALAASLVQSAATTPTP